MAEDCLGCFLLVLTSAALSLAVHVMTLGLVLALSLIWSIPLQTGFVVLSVHGFLSALVLLAYVTFLAMAVHPAIAVLLALLLQEPTFYWLRFTLAARIAGEWSAAYWLLERLCYGIYILLPSFEPYSHRLAGVSRTLRASPADWGVLLYSAGYAVACVLFFYSLAAWLLRHKDLS